MFDKSLLHDSKVQWLITVLTFTISELTFYQVPTRTNNKINNNTSYDSFRGAYFKTNE